MHTQRQHYKLESSAVEIDCAFVNKRSVNDELSSHMHRLAHTSPKIINSYADPWCTYEHYAYA